MPILEDQKGNKKFLKRRKKCKDVRKGKDGMIYKCVDVQHCFMDVKHVFVGETQEQEYQLMKHKYNHQKRYECKICLKSYVTKYNLAKHKIHQPGGLPKEHLCEICGYQSDNLGHLKYHISSVHLHKKLYICDICGGGYRNSHKFTSHMATHSEDKRFICGVCDRYFKRRVDVKHHITRVHPKTMGLQKAKLHCSFCENVYTTKEGLTKHMVRHSGERNFVCDLCGKGFMHRFDLSKHKKSSIHNGKGSEPTFVWRKSGKPFRKKKVHPTEIQTSISPSSAVELNTSSALANYATEAGIIPLDQQAVLSKIPIMPEPTSAGTNDNTNSLVTQTRWAYALLEYIQENRTPNRGGVTCHGRGRMNVVLVRTVTFQSIQLSESSTHKPVTTTSSGPRSARRSSKKKNRTPKW
uniref:C2H2-type domain-containing protein n=1 Tax=Timema genevievae TaxID=629358 RepID=A0A7R9K758_TIMGE|nr:unnamed protein product [Timema genevievae]